MEDYADDKSTKLLDTVASTSSDNIPNLETDAKAFSMETKQSKDVNSTSGSDARKRTKPEGDTAETGSEFSGVIEDNFDWFDGLGDDDIICDDLQDDITSCNNVQFQSSSSNSTEPSAKRYRR